MESLLRSAGRWFASKSKRGRYVGVGPRTDVSPLIDPQSKCIVATVAPCQYEIPFQCRFDLRRLFGMLLKRYQSGEFEQVWREIRLHERVDGEFREEVLEVAEAAMRRVAQNADLISERLRALGWQALLAKYHDLRTLPKATDKTVFTRIEEISEAPIPLTLLAFWRIVGGINWVWDYDASVPQPDLGFDLPTEEYDALCIDAASSVAYLFDEWIDQKQQADSDSLRIDLAPDYLHKANISGGTPYCIEVPFVGADPVFAYERHELPFLDYLRLAFRWAGFPGLDRHANRSDVLNFVVRFRKELIPF